MSTAEPRSAVGVRAMNWAMNPAIIINPAAKPEDLFSWAVAELQDLHTWLNMLACSKCDFEIDPNELAALVNDRLEPVLQGFDAALKSGRAEI